MYLFRTFFMLCLRTLWFASLDLNPQDVLGKFTTLTILLKRSKEHFKINLHHSLFIVFISYDCHASGEHRDNFGRILQVPSNFRFVVEQTLREFFKAIQEGRDAEQSWKKSIYKIISRLDDPVPEYFKSPNFLEQLEWPVTENGNMVLKGNVVAMW